MKFSKLIVTVIGLTLLTAHCYANETGYEVELIIYEDATKRYLDSEDWSYNDMHNQTNDPVSSEETVQTDAQFREIDWDDAVLSDVFQKIQDSPGLNVLLTKRWRQTGLDRDKAYFIEVKSLADQQTHHIDATHSLTDESNANQLNSMIGSIEVNTEQKASINGHVRLVMSRYLHFEVNFDYIRGQLNSLNEMDHSIFPVVAERRMRSREIHYIDHPLVGIIVYATPYTIGSNTD